MQTKQTNTNKMASNANLVEGNCEYLTYIKYMALQRTKIHRDGITTLDAYMQEEREQSLKLHFEGLVELIIQLGYFLYSCKNFGKRPEIELEDIRVEQIYIKTGEKRFSIVIFYRISDEDIEDKFGAEVFRSIIEHIEQALHHYIQNWREGKYNSRNIDRESQYYSAYELFCKQSQLITQNEELMQDQTNFFMYLQQTSLFYEYSLLYRIKNCSLLDYIKTNHENYQIYKEFNDRQENLINDYQQQKKRLKEEKQVLRAKEKSIETNLSDFFTKINNNHNQFVQKELDNEVGKVRFSFKLKERQKISFESILAEQGVNIQSEQRQTELRRPLAQLQYQVEISAQKKSICVKLFLPQIMVSVQNSDFLLFQSNVLTFDTFNVSIQLLEPKLSSHQSQQQKKVPKQIIAFKAVSTFKSSTKESLIQKVLLLMDINMIASRIYQPEMIPKKHVQGGKQSYNKLNNITKKVSHYTKMFMKCAIKVYNQ